MTYRTAVGLACSLVFWMSSSCSEREVQKEWPANRNGRAVVVKELSVRVGPGMRVEDVRAVLGEPPLFMGHGPGWYTFLYPARELAITFDPDGWVVSAQHLQRAVKDVPNEGNNGPKPADKQVQTRKCPD